MHNRYLEHQS